MIPSFNAAISAAKEKQESYQGKFDPAALVEKSEKSERTEKSERSDKPGGSFEITRGLITKEITSATQAQDWHDGERHYRAAMDAADKITPAQIRAEQDRIAKAVATTPQNSAEFQKLVQAQANLTFVKNAKSTIRADRGIACMEWSESQTDEGLKQRFREIGAQWIDAAALKDPSLYQNPELHKRLAATGIPADEIQKLIPLLRAPGTAETKQDLFKYGGDGKNSDSPPPTVTPEIDPKVKPDAAEIAKRELEAKTKSEAAVKDAARAKEDAAKEAAAKDVAAKTKEAAEKREAAEKLEAFKKIEEEDLSKAVATPDEYYSALKYAADRGLPVIVKVGQKGCPPCAAMAPALKEAEESLKGEVVVIRVRADVEATQQLAMDLGADKGVPIVKFARPVPNDTAHRGLQELIPERHKGFTDTRKPGFSQEKDGPETLEYFVANGLQEWRKRKASKK
ncbi:MAG: thioredoxin family protein [Candidatus Melainabacteria bacterium]|nr:thioredoxin family protein [Candidatus Melainabacteria bacterium]